MGYIRRLGDKEYRIVYDVRPKNGKARQQRTETLVGVTKTQAEAYLAQCKVREASKSRLKEVTTTTLFEQFMDSRRAAKRSPKTLERYETLFESYIAPALGTKDINELQQNDLTTWYTRWAEKGKSGRALNPRTVRHIQGGCAAGGHLQTPRPLEHHDHGGPVFTRVPSAGPDAADQFDRIAA